MGTLLLSGLDAANPLAFLAALGTLRTATVTWPHHAVALAWAATGMGWRPTLSLEPSTGGDEQRIERALIEGLDRTLRDPGRHRPFALADDLTVPIGQFRSTCLAAVERAHANERSEPDFLAAFGSDALESRSADKRTGQIADTALRTMSGAGHQHFLGTMRTLAADTHRDHLRRALLEVWQYDDAAEAHSMRWDPADDVRYALRWRNSSGDPQRKRGGAMWGANRLAIEGLPMLPTAAVGTNLETTGFRRRRGEDTTWTWPIWSVMAGLDTVRSMLALRDLQEDAPNRGELAARGIDEVYRCNRITQGKYRNLTPAWPA